MILTVSGVVSVSSATLAVLFGLHGEVSANEEAIAMLHQLDIDSFVQRDKAPAGQYTWLNSCGQNLNFFIT